MREFNSLDGNKRIGPRGPPFRIREQLPFYKGLRINNIQALALTTDKLSNCSDMQLYGNIFAKCNPIDLDFKLVDTHPWCNSPTRRRQ
jgi:hypothetical protein